MRPFLPVAAANVLLSGVIVDVVTSSGAGASVTPNPMADAIRANAAPDSTWTPGPERYKHRMTKNIPVRMSDGTVLHANIDYPTDLKNNATAPNPFPILLTMSPYNKNTNGSTGLGTEPYFVKRSYLNVVVDIQKTGDSKNTFTLFDPKQTNDGVELVH